MDSTYQKPQLKKTITKVFNYYIWIYDSSNSDWFSEYTGQVFADFHIDTKLQNLLNNNIDTALN